MAAIERPLLPTAPPTPDRAARRHSIDNLKVVLVVGVIVAHATMAWTGQEAWVLEEPTVREPLLTILNLMALVGVLFAIPLFFMIAGAFTPPSFDRKGFRRFLVERTLRLGVPLLFYVVVLSPIVEYVDTVENARWGAGFWAYYPYSWRHPSPGPLWFLEVLLVLSLGYALYRRAAPVTRTIVLRPRLLLAAGGVGAVAAYLIRMRVPFGEEVAQDLYLAQSPGWVLGFVLGAVGAEQGWFRAIPARLRRGACRVGWSLMALVVLSVVVNVVGLGEPVEAFWGGGTWQSLFLATAQAGIIIAMSLWLIDVFGRRFDHQGRLLGVMSRAAFAAYVLHQVTLVGTVLVTRLVPWPPEVEYLIAATLAVALSFGIGTALIRLPGVGRFV